MVSSPATLWLAALSIGFVTLEKKLDLTGALTEVENIDLPRTMIDINLQEVAYQAALASAARVLQPSLIEFLR